MRTISYNLAGDRKVNGWGFALRAGALVVAALLLAGFALRNWNHQRARARAVASVSGATRQRLQEMKSESARLKKQVTALQKSLGPAVREANGLIRSKSFSFLAQLDLLESMFSPGIRARHLALANSEAGRIYLTITAQSLKELFALYKKLAPYGLVIANETQTREEYQVKLHFQVTHEAL